MKNVHVVRSSSHQLPEPGREARIVDRLVEALLVPPPAERGEHLDVALVVRCGSRWPRPPLRTHGPEPGDRSAWHGAASSGEGSTGCTPGTDGPCGSAVPRFDHLGGAPGCLAMLAFSILASVFLTIVLNLALR